MQRGGGQRGGKRNGETGKKQRPKCIRMYEQSKVVSINEHCFRLLRSSHALKDSTLPLILLIYPQGLEREFRIRHVVVGVKGPTTDGDTTLASRLSDAETNYVYKV